VEVKQLSLDGNILCTGVRRASARTQEPILCLLKRNAIMFVALSGLRLVVSWEYPASLQLKGGLGLLIPITVAELLSSEAIKKPLNIRLEGKQATLATTDEWGGYQISWHSDVSKFPAPEDFNQFLAYPPALVEVSYISVSDAAHLAVARLATVESAAEAHRDKLAILVDFSMQRLMIDGREVTRGEATRYFFDPRLIIRALEFVKSDRIGVAVTNLAAKNQAIFSIVSAQGDCKVHCAILSIGLDTQKLYPLPPGHNR
jgi:hypothetical protein